MLLIVWFNLSVYISRPVALPLAWDKIRQKSEPAEGESGATSEWLIHTVKPL